AARARRDRLGLRAGRAARHVRAARARAAAVPVQADTTPLMLPPMPELQGARHAWVPVDGFKMHVAEVGPVDGPPIVALHGWPEAGWGWHKGMPPLADAGFRVIAPDLRGHGWSETPGRGYEKAQFAADVIALLDGLDLDRVDLMGHDWGAMAGFMAAIDHP